MLNVFDGSFGVCINGKLKTNLFIYLLFLDRMKKKGKEKKEEKWEKRCHILSYTARMTHHTLAFRENQINRLETYYITGVGV